MSATAVPTVPRAKRYGIMEQGGWTTAGGDASTYIELDCADTEFVPDVKLLETGAAYGGRTKRDGNIYVHEKGAMPTITLEGIAKRDEIDQFIYGACQYVVEESGNAPYKKTHTLHTTNPDFAANAGQKFTIIERMEASSDSFKGRSFVCKRLTLTWNAGEPLRYSAEMVGQGAIECDANPSGTWSVTEANYMFTTDIDRIKIKAEGGSSVDFNMESYELVIEHDVVGVGQDGNGGFQTIAMVNRNVTFKMKVVHDTDWDAFITNYKANKYWDIHLGVGSSEYGAVEGDFNIDMHCKITVPPTKSHDAILAGEISGECLDANGGTTAALTIITGSGVSHDW